MGVILAHGTSADNLPSIMESGILPRGNKESLWSNCPSHSRRVYLSNAYAFYFANNAAEEGSDLAVIEVDVNIHSLYPDEDYLGQATQNDAWTEKYPNLIDRTLMFRDLMDTFSESERLKLAKISLEKIGNVSHKGRIRPEDIRRIAVIPHELRFQIVIQEFDPFICVRNYQFCGEGYRQFQNSLFDRFPYKILALT